MGVSVGRGHCIQNGVYLATATYEAYNAKTVDQ